MKKMFSHQSSLMNDHHSTAVVMHKCSKRQQIVVGAGVKVKERLEFLLENDDDLKRAIQEDEDDMNRSRLRRYVNVVPAQAWVKVVRDRFCLLLSRRAWWSRRRRARREWPGWRQRNTLTPSTATTPPPGGQVQDGH